MPMQTTVKASKAAKRRLERLRAQITRQTGRKVSQRELVDLLIARASRDSAATAAALASGSGSMSLRELRRFLKSRKPWGIDDSSVDIDAWLYGGES